MKELFRERDLATVGFYQTVLEEAGISTFVKNENLSTTEGVSIPDFFPALCILNDDDYDTARELIRKRLERAEDAAALAEVVCGNCGETVPGSFDTCWNCQSPIVQSPDEQEA
jgi:hypothetical protein